MTNGADPAKVVGAGLQGWQNSNSMVSVGLVLPNFYQLLEPSGQSAVLQVPRTPVQFLSVDLCCLHSWHAVPFADYCE